MTTCAADDMARPEIRTGGGGRGILPREARGPGPRRLRMRASPGAGGRHAADATVRRTAAQRGARTAQGVVPFTALLAAKPDGPAAS